MVKELKGWRIYLSNMVCFDTSFVIDFLRGDKKAVSMVENFKEKDEFMSLAAPSLIELISSAQLGIKRNQEKDKISRFISSITVLSLDKDSAFLAGELEGDLIMAGEQIGNSDVMIGAIAKSNGESLITRNVKHFSKIQRLKVISYWLFAKIFCLI